MRPRPPRAVLLLPLLLFPLVLAACSNTNSASVVPPSRQQSFPGLLKSSRAAATSDFERAVLDRAIKTGSIAAADYEDAVSKYLDCVRRAGVGLDAVKQPNGIYKWKPKNVTDLNRYGDVTNKCADGTTMRIEGLYKLQVANPNMLPTDEAAVQCLIDNQVAPKGYDAAQFNKDFSAQFKGSGLDISSSLVQMCLNSLGYSVGVN